MNRKLRAGLLVAGAAAVWGAATWVGLQYRPRTEPAAALLRRIPAENALLLFVDFSGLRRSGVLGLLEAPQAVEEAAYRDFARQTGFDYQRDLDTAVLAVAPEGKFLLLRGRFDWKKLRAYVQAQNGNCDESLCRMQGSTPERRISFFPVNSGLMALAVSDAPSAALRMKNEGNQPSVDPPDAPVWVSVPPSLLHSGNSLPAETRVFARGMERAESVVLSFVPESNRFAARLGVRCRTTQDAAELAAQLARTTTLLREMFEREHHSANPTDLSGVLASGTFRSEGSGVIGYWRIERAFIENLFGGLS